MLTTFDLDEYVYEALRAGASGFLLKDAPPEQLVAAVRVVAAGDALLAPVGHPAADRGVRAAPPPAAKPPAELDELTAARARGAAPARARALERRDRARARARRGDGEDPRRPHLQKLDLRDRAQAVVLAYETGLVVPGDAA